MAASPLPPMYVELNGTQRYPVKTGEIYVFSGQKSHEEIGNDNFIIVDGKGVDGKPCCVLDISEEGAFVYDLLSRCGTFLNGQHLVPLKKALVKNGDVMRLGTIATIKLINEQMEISQDSSGYAETNKNNSDIVDSSPDSTTQKESRLKRMNSQMHKSQDDTEQFLVPTVPVPQYRLARMSGGKNCDESTENCHLSLDENQNSRSDSFTIPETQHCKPPRTSTTSNCSSIADSDVENDETNADLNVDSLNEQDQDDSDICIPETQDVPPKHQMPRNSQAGGVKLINVLKTIEEKSVDLKDSDDEEDLNGSQFRMCTQEFHEGFGEEENESSLHSQVIPLIKHTTPVVLNASNQMLTSLQREKEDAAGDENSAENENDKELENINWNAAPTAAEENCGEQAKNINSTCSTPDLFEFAAFNNKKGNNNENADNEDLFEENVPNALEDEEDFLPTQVLPSKNNNNKSNQGDKIQREKDILCGDKEDEQLITLSDKENMHPDNLEPITDIPPMQLFAMNAETATAPGNDKNLKVLLPTALDDQDDILTQVFPQTSTPANNSTVAQKYSKNNCLHSTFLDEKAANKTTPASFFEEMENTPKKTQFPTGTTDVFKVPELGPLSVASTTSVNTEYYMDLLMCTPQLIKDHLELDIPEDLRKHMLAVKNRNLFGIDTDDSDDTEDDQSSGSDKCLVELVNVPKDSNDFDKLLPHLKNERKHLLRDKQTTANEAFKDYKFNILFGHEQEKSKPSTTNQSAIYSRDERHAARDKQKNVKKLDDKKQENTVRRSGRSNSKDEKSVESAIKKDLEKIGAPQKESSHKKKKGSSEKKETGDDVEKAEKSKKLAKDSNDEIPEVTKKKESSKKKETEVDDKKKVEKSKKLAEDSNDELPEVTKKREGSKKKETGDDDKEKAEKSQKLAKGSNDEIPEVTKKKVSSKKKETGDDDKEKAEKHQKLAKGSNDEIPEVMKKKESSKKKETGDDDKEKVEKSKKLVKDSNDKIPEVEKKKVEATHSMNKAKPKENDNDQDKNGKENKKRQIKRRSSLDKLLEHQQMFMQQETDVKKTRLARTKSIIEDKEKGKIQKSFTTSTLDTVASSDNTDLIPTQPLRRTTRRMSRSDQKAGASSDGASSRSSSANRSLTRSSSRLELSMNSAANEVEVASKPKTERKRKAEVPVPPQKPPQTESKRLRRTVSRDAKDSTVLSTSTKPPVVCLISTTMVDPDTFKNLYFNANGLWAVAKDPIDSNVLVIDKAYRTFKFLLAMARGIPIVTTQWLQKVNETKSIKNVRISDYLFQDKEFEERHKFTLIKSLKIAKDNHKRLFEGHEFLLTANIQPQQMEMKALIEAAGGEVLKKNTPAPRENQKLYLVSSVDDRKEWHRFRRINKNIVIISTEGIMVSILRQNCKSLAKHALS